jgi:HD superfamily phosphohydrolase
MASTKTSKVPYRHSRTKINSSRNSPTRQSGDKFEDLGYFYDTIHGRVAFGELPMKFQPALKAALGSPALDRLTRISQLGHTSLTYFSATQTRFSHAIGTLLMMNRLFTHLWPNGNLPPSVISEVSRKFSDVYKLCQDKATCIRCHLLLAALYQDCGELPFQKVTSLYFRPHPNELNSLKSKISNATPDRWKTKDVFTLRALCEDLKEADLQNYDLNFLAFLITGDGCLQTSPLQMFRQMTDGPIDADRLDYVFRDALLTIGSVSRAEMVLHSIVRYESDHVVVDDPRPAADFLATRARLWTFVYTSPDVRFRQALLKSFLQAGFSTEEGREIFRKVGFVAEVTLDDFLLLDDHSMLQRIRTVREREDFSHLLETGRNACEGLLKTVTDYECRILPKPRPDATPLSRTTLQTLPNDLFFDLLLDHDEEHKLYLPKSVRVEQSLTRDISSSGESVCLEDCCGAIGPIFFRDNRAPLVRDSFFLFRPKQRGKEWNAVDKEISQRTLYEAIDREDVRREINSLDDTWDNPQYTGRKTAVSCAFEDRPTIVRIIRELQKQNQQYRVLLDSLLGLGNTALENSQNLIRDAEAVLVIASRAYITSAIKKPAGNIAAEVQEIYAKNTAKRSPIVVLPVDSYDSLKDMPDWSWSKLNPKWVTGPPILYGPLRHAGDTKLRDAVKAAIQDLNKVS